MKGELRSLAPFLDNDELLRVGGRLHNSALPFNGKFPIILASRNHLTEMIVLHEHLKLLHGNQQLLICSFCQKYWIPRIRQVIKKVIHKCLTCFKLKVKPAQQQMGILPTPRVQPSRPFINSGLPILLKPGLPRNWSTIKAYVYIFVCLSIKAIHIKLVTALSTEAFIAAFRRFVSRWGRCSNLYSDNGTNFLGTNNQLKDLASFL
ncbi:uncharacterized protein LOC142319949 [Lycorma delicatula]|uniref:uncharacterized protein LOC142319949 n=1 Tax=Lycorma delicatula TaxID=130591 RepID=UPI003F513F28